jgi:hypothetical protein
VTLLASPLVIFHRGSYNTITVLELSDTLSYIQGYSSVYCVIGVGRVRSRNKHEPYIETGESAHNRPDLSSKRAPQKRQDSNFEKEISGQKSQIGLDTKTY